MYKACIVFQAFVQDQIFAIPQFWWTHGCQLLSQFTHFKCVW